MTYIAMKSSLDASRIVDAENYSLNQTSVFCNYQPKLLVKMPAFCFDTRT